MANCLLRPRSAPYVVRLTQLAEHEPSAPYYRLLCLFATGTWQDYAGNPNTYPALTPQQAAKLRQLTIVSLADARRVLSYSDMESALGLEATADASATRILEDLIIDGIYQSLFAGRLDGMAQEFHVDSVTARDVPHTTHDGHDALAPLLTELTAWSQRADDALRTLDERIASLHDDRARSAHQKQSDHDALVHAVAGAYAGAKSTDEPMDLSYVPYLMQRQPADRAPASETQPCVATESPRPPRRSSPARAPRRPFFV